MHRECLHGVVNTAVCRLPLGRKYLVNMQNKPFTWPTNLPTWLEQQCEQRRRGERGLMLFMKLPKREYLSQLGDCLSISIQLETGTGSAI